MGLIPIPEVSRLCCPRCLSVDNVIVLEIYESKSSINNYPLYCRGRMFGGKGVNLPQRFCLGRTEFDFICLPSPIHCPLILQYYEKFESMSS
jgi:hypothetical protein